MPAFSKGDYTAMDRPEVLSVLFHPRKEYEGRIPTEAAMDVFIPVEDNVGIGGCFHMARSDGPNILFFHGNGEIVSDYDALGPMYNQMGINFLAVDYRGYGRSSGTPTIAAMMSDCHNIFDFARNWLIDSGYSGPMMVMGRSLGSASALELAVRHPGTIEALIVESGFAYSVPLLRLLGIDPDVSGIREENGFGNLEKMKSVDKPTLIIHAEYDHIIPFADGQALFDTCPSAKKSLLKIPGANHNNIFMRGITVYLEAVKRLADGLMKQL